MIEFFSPEPRARASFAESDSFGDAVNGDDGSEGAREEVLGDSRFLLSLNLDMIPLFCINYKEM